MVYEVTTFDKKNFSVSEGEAQAIVLAKGNGENKPILVNGGMIMTSAIASVMPVEQTLQVTSTRTFEALPAPPKTDGEKKRLKEIYLETKKKMGWTKFNLIPE